MAKEYRQRPGDPDTKQWRDLSAGVQGWNNLDREDAPSFKKEAPRPTPYAAPPMAPSMAQAPVSSPLAGLMATDPIAPTDVTTTPAKAQADVSGSAGGPVELPGVGMLRMGLGNRIYPQGYSALAGLKRIY